MAAESNEDEAIQAARDEAQRQQQASNGKDSAAQESEEEEDDDEDDGEDEEPKLKYTRLTSSLGPVYRNGDATSTFMVANDKMVRRMAQASRATICRNTHAEV